MDGDILLFVAHREEFDIVHRSIHEKLEEPDLIVLPLFYDDTAAAMSRLRLSEGGGGSERKLFITATAREDDYYIVYHRVPASVRKNCNSSIGTLTCNLSLVTPIP